MSWSRSVLLLSLIALSVAGVVGCSDDKTTKPTEDPVAFTNADGINGGRLYDKFWASETGWSQNDPNLATFNARADFFRCKQCHGWDRLGRAGSYINRAPSASRPNISAVNLKQFAAGHTPQELFDAMKRSTGRRSLGADLATYNPATNSTIGDQMPDYGTFMSDDSIWDLVKYMKNEALDTGLLYDSSISGAYPTGSLQYSNIGKDGSAAQGDAIFAAKCAACHGANGASILVDGNAFTVGSHVRAKPYEDQHKIKFGQLGSDMGSQVTNTTDMKHLYKALTNATKYPNPAPAAE